MTSGTGIDAVFDTLGQRGRDMYGGEAVTQLQHALQCATLAIHAGASDALVAAALLHDYGHLISKDEGAAERGLDMRHEETAARFLAPLFGPDVTEPIRLHVAAKRYLCAVDQDYLSTLSPASVASLMVQGGPFTADEAHALRDNPHWEPAVQLRRWDDLAKDPRAPVLRLSSLRACVVRALRPEVRKSG
ncbi:MAG: HD domain-containing protein [Hyphomicrobiales bacterium]|nr:HD domain-containing protein [Hyphomicrobiales bacterium]